MSRILLKKYIVAILIGCIVAGLVAVYVIGYDRIARKIGIGQVSVVLDWSDQQNDFPAIEAAGLSEFQSKIVDITRQEFLEQPSGTKYSEGASEAWCANFVSWIMNEVGEPLKNPHSGSWRIPGTFTLKEYYEAVSRFRPVASGYEPKLGDVAIYRSSPLFGDHANIVLLNEDGVMTTIGGNEGDRVRVYKNTGKSYEGLLGYGVLE